MNKKTKRFVAVGLATLTLATSMLSANAYTLTDFNNARVKYQYYTDTANCPEISISDLVNGKTKITYTNITGTLSEGKKILIIHPDKTKTAYENEQLFMNYLGKLKLVDAYGNALTDKYPLYFNQNGDRAFKDKNGEWVFGYEVICGSNSVFSCQEPTYICEAQKSNWKVTVKYYDIKGLIGNNFNITLNGIKPSSVNVSYEDMSSRGKTNITAVFNVPASKEDVTYRASINGVSANSTVKIKFTEDFYIDSVLTNKVKHVAGTTAMNKVNSTGDKTTMYAVNSGKTLKIYMHDYAGPWAVMKGKNCAGINGLSYGGFLGSYGQNKVDTIEVYDIENPTHRLLKQTCKGYTAEQWKTLIINKGGSGL